MAFKIDFETAYDNVNWDFLRATVHDFAFPTRIIDLIMFCVSSTSLAILWNGEMMESFKLNRGLRQGDPMSPYLFVLCLEKLGMMISKKVESRE